MQSPRLVENKPIFPCFFLFFFPPWHTESKISNLANESELLPEEERYSVLIRFILPKYENSGGIDWFKEQPQKAQVNLGRWEPV